MNHQFILWIAMPCCAAHMLEEYFYNWKDWVLKTLGLVAACTDFYVVNIYVLFMGVVCASVGWNCIWVSLILPGFMLVNAVIFHIIPVIRYRKIFTGHHYVNPFVPACYSVLLLLCFTEWRYYHRYCCICIDRCHIHVLSHHSSDNKKQSFLPTIVL